MEINEHIKQSHLQNFYQQEPFFEIIEEYQQILVKNLDLQQENNNYKIKQKKLESNLKDVQLYDSLQQQLTTVQNKYMIKQKELDELNQSLKNVTLDFNNILQQNKETQDENKLLTQDKENITQVNIEMIQKIEQLQYQKEKDQKEIRQLQNQKDELLIQSKNSEEAQFLQLDRIKQLQKEKEQDFEKMLQQEESLRQQRQQIKKEKEIFENDKQQYQLNQNKEKQYHQPKNVNKQLNTYKNYHKFEITSIKSSDNGNNIASICGDQTIKVYNPVQKDNNIFYQNQSYYFTSLDVSKRDDQLFLAGNSNYSAHIINQQSQIKHELTGHKQQINLVSFLNQMDKCITASERVIKIWDLNNGYCEKTLDLSSKITCMDNFASQNLLVTGDIQGNVKIQSSTDGRIINEFKNLFDDRVNCVKLSENNQQIICSYIGGDYLKCLDLRMLGVLHTLIDDDYQNNYQSNKICFGPNDNSIYAGNIDNSIFEFDLCDGRKINQLLTKQDGVMITCTYIPKKQILISGDTRGNLYHWE